MRPSTGSCGEGSVTPRLPLPTTDPSVFVVQWFDFADRLAKVNREYALHLTSVANELGGDVRQHLEGLGEAVRDQVQSVSHAAQEELEKVADAEREQVEQAEKAEREQAREARAPSLRRLARSAMQRKSATRA